MDNLEYQRVALAAFQRKNAAYFDTVREWCADLVAAGPEWLREQVDWMVNGSYGDGVCFALQVADSWRGGNRNHSAMVGAVVCKALYGAAVEWRRLTPAAREMIGSAVAEFCAAESHEWAQQVEPELLHTARGTYRSK